MDKIGKPRGLIDYMALKDETSERAGAAPIPVWKHILRPRTLIYFTLWAGIGVGLIAALFLRSPIDFNVTPNRDPLYVVQGDGTIRNIYTLRLRNKHGEDTTYRIEAVPEGAAAGGPMTLTLEGEPGDTVTVKADETATQRMYLEAPKGTPLAVTTRSEVRIRVQDVNGGDHAQAEAVFNGRAPQ
ncbi:FixG Ig-like domain-containing protein [Paenirhodobacter sp.]|uniref:FixG Ig-like domain-containing protein n=1 Tax=Paenirhodobacter sp. TaxID=1965326 RepID=UPI003B5019B6